MSAATGPYASIHKYALHAPAVVADVPIGGRVLHVATQHGVPAVWVQVDLSVPTEQRTFFGVPTGGLVPADAIYLGTAHDVEGEGLVMHIYERSSNA